MILGQLAPAGPVDGHVSDDEGKPIDQRGYLETSMLRRLLLHDRCTLLVDGQCQRRLLVVTKHLSETEIALWRGRVSVTVPNRAWDGEG